MRTLFVSPKSIQKVTEKVTWFETELGKIMIDLGVDIIWIPDDLGMKDGPFLSPLAFRKNIFPHMKKMVQTFKRTGVKVLLHCDGHVMPLIDDIIQIGFDGIHPIERKSGMSLQLMKTKYGDKLTIIGNVDATELLPHGTTPNSCLEQLQNTGNTQYFVIDSGYPSIALVLTEYSSSLPIITKAAGNVAAPTSTPHLSSPVSVLQETCHSAVLVITLVFINGTVVENRPTIVQSNL